MPAVSTQFTFEHGTFEKVNYLGYDDHVVLNRSMSFLTEGASNENVKEHDGGDGLGGKLLTILTVGVATRNLAKVLGIGYSMREVSAP